MLEIVLNIVLVVLVITLILVLVGFVVGFVIAWFRERSLPPEEKQRRSRLLWHGSGEINPKQARNWRYAYGFMTFAYIFVLATIVFNSWQGASQRQIEQQSPQSVNEEMKIEGVDTSGWKAYRSGYLGFEIKYPNGWFFNIHSDTESFNIISISNNDIVIGVTTTPHYGRTLEEIGGGGYYLTEDSQFAPYFGTHIIQSITETTIDGEPAILKTIKWGPPAPPDFPPEPIGYEGDVLWAMEETVEQHTFVIHGESQYHISVKFHGENIDQQKELYNQVLSTLRFIEPDDALSVDSSKILTMLTRVPSNYKTFSDRYIDLSSLDIITGERERLIRWQGCEALAVLSPEKRRLAYWVKTNQRCESEYTQGGDVGRVDLWITELSKYDKKFFSNQTIARGIWKFTTPKWSSDENLVAYDKVIEHPFPQEREHQLYVYDLKNEKEDFIGSFFGAAHEIIGFSSNNEYVYYSDREFLYKVNLRTKAQEKIYTREFGFSSEFTLSPDKSKIAVFSSEDWYGGKTTPSITKIGVIDTSINEYRELYSGTDHSLTLYSSMKEEKGPVFLPDNSRVVYGASMGQQGNETGLWILDVVNGKRRVLEEIVSSSINGITPVALSDDGKLLLYTGWVGETTYYYTLSLSTGEVQEVESTKTATQFLGERLLDWLN